MFLPDFGIEILLKFLGLNFLGLMFECELFRFETYVYWCLIEIGWMMKSYEIMKLELGHHIFSNYKIYLFLLKIHRYNSEYQFVSRPTIFRNVGWLTPHVQPTMKGWNPGLYQPFVFINQVCFATAISCNQRKTNHIQICTTFSLGVSVNHTQTEGFRIGTLSHSIGYEIVLVSLCI